MLFKNFTVNFKKFIGEILLLIIFLVNKFRLIILINDIIYQNDRSKFFYEGILFFKIELLFNCIQLINLTFNFFK